MNGMLIKRIRSRSWKSHNAVLRTCSLYTIQCISQIHCKYSVYRETGHYSSAKSGQLALLSTIPRKDKIYFLKGRFTYTIMLDHLNF